MFDSLTILGVVCLYMGLLSAVAAWAEGKSRKGRSLANNPLVYSFALGVYCTTWTYYGSVGTAATSGLLFLTVYFGPTMVIVLWGTIQRKLIRIRNEYRITSIADFISSRYNRSQALAALVTVIAFVGITPYLALQFKAVGSTFAMLTAADREILPGLASYRDLLVTGLLIVFTIVVGMRRLDAAERHPGMMMALAVECCVKLVAFLAAGAFVTYGMFAGFGDILDRTGNLAYALPKAELTEPFSALKWNAYLLASMAAVMCLPRQFHVAVIENLDENHVKTAMWVFPLYLLLISVFTFPIAVAGLLKGFPMDAADTFVLALPLNEGQTLLSLFVFLGGLSAAAGMIMVCSIAISTMMTNHLLLPMFGWFRPLGLLRRHLLGCRWCVVTLFICIGYWSQKYVGEPYMLGNMGMISFAAVAQFAPALFGGLFWRRAHEAGAFVGIAGGFLIWIYTLLLPAFIESGWWSNTILNEGLWGIRWLNPRSLFGLALGDPVLHSLFWSMLFNIGAFVIVSLSFEQSEEQQRRVEEFMGASATRPALGVPAGGRRSIHLGEKEVLIVDLLSEFFGPWKAIEITEECVAHAGLAGKKWITVLELSELLSQVERTLTGSVGAAEAHKALADQHVITPTEARAISEAYGEILAELNVPPEELKQRIDYHRERATLLARHAAELEEKVSERTKELEAAQAELVKREKLSVLGQLTAFVSHELRNPLAVIRSSAFYLRKKVALTDDKVMKHLDRIDGQIVVCDSIITEMLEYTRGRRSRAVPGNLDVWLEQVIKLLDVPKGVHLVRDSESGLPPVLYDAEKLQSVIVNLVQNSFHAVLKRAAAHSAEDGSYSPKVVISMRRTPEDGVCITVDDNGIGMDQETLAHACEPLFTTKARGTGLGLAVVHKVVAEHGSEVVIDSQEHSGTAISFVLTARRPSQGAR